jgi:hypothetical protein
MVYGDPGTADIIPIVFETTFPVFIVLPQYYIVKGSKRR